MTKRENAVVKMALIRLVQPSVATNLQLKKKPYPMKYNCTKHHKMRYAYILYRCSPIYDGLGLFFVFFFT